MIMLQCLNPTCNQHPWQAPNDTMSRGGEVCEYCGLPAVMYIEYPPFPNSGIGTVFATDGTYYAEGSLERITFWERGQDYRYRQVAWINQYRARAWIATTPKPYDPETDSDVAWLGEYTDLAHAIHETWRQRHSLMAA